MLFQIITVVNTQTCHAAFYKSIREAMNEQPSVWICMHSPMLIIVICEVGVYLEHELV